MSVPRPENIGDIYFATDYPSVGQASYGAVYREEDETREGRLLWWIEMEDGDAFKWPDDEEQPDMTGATLKLVRRNPLPEWMPWEPTS